MTNAAATITENAATVAEQGAHVAPEKTSSKKGASQKKGAPKGQKAAKGKAKAAPKKQAKAGKKAKPAPAKETSTPRAESKGAKILELIGRPRGDSGRDPEGHWLAETFDPGLSFDRRQEARSQDRVHEDRGWRSHMPDDPEVEFPDCRRSRGRRLFYGLANLLFVGSPLHPSCASGQVQPDPNGDAAAIRHLEEILANDKRVRPSDPTECLVILNLSRKPHLYGGPSRKID
jgi:hypothetical protein